MTIAGLVTRGLRAMTAYHVPRPAGIRAKLDANESPHALPPEVAEALGRELATVALHRYPEADPVELRAHLAAELGVAPAALSFGNGSDELLALLCAAFGEPRPGKTRATVLYPDPSFVVYRIAALGHGLDPIEVPLDDDMQLDFELVDDAMTGAAPNLAFFALPNNPTGTLWTPERVADLAAAHPGTIVVADEAYIDYGGRTLLPRLADLPNLVVMRTLSKVGLAGLRIGFLVADQAIVREVEKVRPPYNLGALNQRAALWMLRTQGAWLRARAADVVAERARLAAALATVPDVRVFPSEANLLLFRIGRVGDGRAKAAWQALAERGVLVRNLDRPGPLAGCLRVTPGTPEENDLFLTELRAVLTA
ncbi:MAG: histidinol-phosphate transaminase [Myxococcales bacterium]|nr:histidinol-phosphate transaminase [Myxococcales bacterium]